MDVEGEDLLYDEIYNNKLLKVEKNYVVDNYRNSGRFVATRVFRPEYKSKLPANRRLDPYFDRNRRHTRHFESVRDYVNQSALRGV